MFIYIYTNTMHVVTCQNISSKKSCNSLRESHILAFNTT